MKTITTLLMTFFLLAGTFHTVLAGDDARKESAPRQRNEIKAKRESTAERTRGNRGETKTTTGRRTQVQLPDQRKNRDDQVTSTEIRRVRTVRNKQQDRNGKQVRNERPANNERRDRNVNNRDNERRNQAPYDNRRNENRRVNYRPNNHNQANLSYYERQLRCSFCTGRGFTIHIDGVRHLRCNHCEGRGIRIIRELNVNACPVCYNPLHNQNLECSLEDLAWMETNRIAVALELSNHQRNRVFEINYRYITHHYKGHNYPTSRRDREIRRVLQLGQIAAFAVLLNELYNGDICYNCSNEHY